MKRFFFPLHTCNLLLKGKDRLEGSAGWEPENFRHGWKSLSKTKFLCWKILQSRSAKGWLCPTVSPTALSGLVVSLKD